LQSAFHHLISKNFLAWPTALYACVADALSPTGEAMRLTSELCSLSFRVHPTKSPLECRGIGDWRQAGPRCRQNRLDTLTARLRITLADRTHAKKLRRRRETRRPRTALDLGCLVSDDRKRGLSGGFAEEVLPLLVKSLRGMAFALSANRGEAAAASGGDADIRRLVEQAALPAEALTILDAANPAVMPATASGVEPLIAATGRILATIRRNEPSLYRGAA
jgi:hypothetical protein